jgi:hypothetical protein
MANGEWRMVNGELTDHEIQLVRGIYMVFAW